MIDHCGHIVRALKDYEGAPEELFRELRNLSLISKL